MAQLWYKALIFARKWRWRTVLPGSRPAKTVHVLMDYEDMPYQVVILEDPKFGVAMALKWYIQILSAHTE